MGRTTSVDFLIVYISWLRNIINQAINNKACCATSDPAVNAYCWQGEDSQDSFCMKYPVPDGEPCGLTAETNYAGRCAYGTSSCQNGVCVGATTPAPTTTTTTTVTTTTVTTAACPASGDDCWDATAGAPIECCGAPCAGFGPGSKCP